MNDELYHHGVMGMKWGKHTQSALNSISKSGVGKALNKYQKTTAKVGAHLKEQRTPEFKKAYKQANKDMLTHPIHSTAAQMKLIKEHPGKALSLDTKSAKALNADTASRVAKSKARAADKAMEKKSKQVSTKKLETGKTLSQKLLKDAGIVVTSQVAGLALMKTGNLTAGVVLASAGTYYGVGHAIVSTVKASKQ